MSTSKNKKKGSGATGHESKAQAHNAKADSHDPKAKAHDPASEAYRQAEKDILHDPELSDSDPTDDLDEGELARKDNSDEEAVDQLQKGSPGHSTHHRAGKGDTSSHSGKGSEK